MNYTKIDSACGKTISAIVIFEKRMVAFYFADLSIVYFTCNAGSLVDHSMPLQPLIGKKLGQAELVVATGEFIFPEQEKKQNWHNHNFCHGMLRMVADSDPKVYFFEWICASESSQAMLHIWASCTKYVDLAAALESFQHDAQVFKSPEPYASGTDNIPAEHESLQEHSQSLVAGLEAMAKAGKAWAKQMEFFKLNPDMSLFNNAAKTQPTKLDFGPVDKGEEDE